MSRYSDILDEKYIEIETLRRKTVKEDYITLYNLIIQVGEHIKLEISNFNSSVYLNFDAVYSALAKLKNNYRIAEYIKDKYDYHHVDFSYPQRVKLKELTSLYNNGVFMEEEQFNIFRYNKWSTTYEAEEVNNNLTKKEIHIWLLSLFGPLLYCAILRGILLLSNKLLL